MKVIINGKVYDSDENLISIFLYDEDKKNIANMYTDCYLYSCFPEDYDTKLVVEEINRNCDLIHYIPYSGRTGIA